MTFLELRSLIEINQVYNLKLISGKTATGYIDGPYRGDEKWDLKDFKKDYLYVFNSDSNLTTRIYLEEIVGIEHVTI